MTYHEAIRCLFDDDPRERGSAEIASELASRWPGQRWRRSSVTTILIALCINHPSRRHYPTYATHAFLKRVGRGRYRPWSAQDGPRERWIDTADRGAGAWSPTPRRQPMPKQTATVQEDQQRPTWQVARDGPVMPHRVDSRAQRARREALHALVEEIHGEPFQPRYRRRDHGPIVVGWPARLRSYFWPTPSMGLAATHRTMSPWFEQAGALARHLDEGSEWTRAHRATATALALAMLQWGRVPPRAPVSPFMVEAVFLRSLGHNVHPEPPMNSGWTKVAALATAFLETHPERHPHMIWDSRVSASIIARLDALMLRAGEGDPSALFPGIGTVPGRGGTRATAPLATRLRLRWPNGYRSWRTQDAGSALVREIRDVLNTEGYPRMPVGDGTARAWTIRGVESVLFMDGY